MYIQQDRITAKALFNEAYQFLVDKYGKSKQSQLSPASPYLQVISVLAELSELNFQYIENAISELNILTAKNKDSISGLSRLTGHNPTRGMSARGKVSIKLQQDFTDFEGDYIIIPKYAQIKCLTNNLIYLLVPDTDNIRIQKVANTTVECVIYEGTYETQTFTSDGTKLQSFSVITKSLTDHFMVYVNVNGVNYKTVESLYDLSANENGVIIKTGINGGLDVYFGNGNFGNIPPQGALINVSYIKTSGNFGNLPSRLTEIYFNFSDTGLDVYGNDIDLNQNLLTITTLMNPTFGSNEEDVNFTRLIAPYMSRNYVLVNTDNYYYFLKNLNYFSVVSVYNTVNDNFLQDDNIIYVFLVPDISKKIINKLDYFSVDENEFILTDQEKLMISTYVDNSGQQLIGSEMIYIDGQIKRYAINVVITYYNTYDTLIIKTNIISELNKYFINIQRRDVIPRSDIIALLKTIDGIDSVNVFFISQENEQAITNGSYSQKVYVYNSTTQKREWVDTKTVTLQTGQDPLIGFNEFGDIMIGSADIPIIRGGWYDRYGRYYEPDISSNLCSVNIFINNSVEYNLYAKENQAKLKSYLTA